ncbi:hypothetical protein YC2023_118256 [Brassica napus]
MLASDGRGRSFFKIPFEDFFSGRSVHNQHPTPSPPNISCITSTYKTPIKVTTFVSRGAWEESEDKHVKGEWSTKFFTCIKVIHTMVHFCRELT